MTDDQIVERWLESRPSPLTREGCAADFERSRQFVGVDKLLSEVELGDVQRYAKHVAQLKTTKKKKLRASRQMMVIFVVRS